ncbi:MAG TPA: hypothetical protein VNQ99_12210 [Xanthobacteraceae bacterium]|nr:hypothetical protein [Xanthobacteraceae bacterium]
MLSRTQFPSPWSVTEHEESFDVCDGSGRSLFYVYFDDDAVRASVRNRMTKKQARTLVDALVTLAPPDRRIKSSVPDQRLPIARLPAGEP